MELQKTRVVLKQVVQKTCCRSMVGLYRAGSQKGFILCILRLVTLLLRGDRAILTAAGISAVLTGMVFRRRQMNNMLVAEGNRRQRYTWRLLWPRNLIPPLE
jgi:hypothetical protein